MKVLAAPAHALISDFHGSDTIWPYRIMKSISRAFPVEFYAICGRCKFSNNVKLEKLHIYETLPGRRSHYTIHDATLFTLIYTSLARRLLKKFGDEISIVQHMFPLGYNKGFNPLIFSSQLSNKPFIVGPLQPPQEYVDATDYSFVSGTKGLQAVFMFDLQESIFKLARKTLSLLHEKTLRRADALVFYGPASLELYERSYPQIVKEKLALVIPPGLEIDLFPYVPPIEKDHLEILSVGYLTRRRGIQFAIKAMPQVLKEIPNVRLRIVGSGPYLNVLSSLVDALRLRDHVIFEGYVPRWKLHNYYSRCDVFVVPTLAAAYEVYLEAEAVGRPCIGTMVHTVPEAILHDQTGLIVPKADVDSLAKAMVTLLSNKKLRYKMGENARDFVEKNFDSNKLAAKWYNLYDSVLNP